MDSRMPSINSREVIFNGLYPKTEWTSSTHKEILVPSLNKEKLTPSIENFRHLFTSSETAKADTAKQLRIKPEVVNQLASHFSCNERFAFLAYVSPFQQSLDNGSAR